jgi:hypothetical protein
MENENEKTSNFRFLGDESVSKYFADLNIKLLSGRHVQVAEYAAFSILEDYYDDFRFYYQQLYGMDLVRRVFDQSTYYYLSFFDAGRGKLGDPARYRAITEIQTVTALMLLDMYFTRYFDSEKKITWAIIREEIQSGDHRMALQRLLFPEIRAAYTEPEWQSAERRFKNSVTKFDALGWVSQLSGAQEELCFLINPSIHRIAELYEAELQDLEAFSVKVKAGRPA